MTEEGEVVVFQLWRWLADRYRVRHFLLSNRGATWHVAERRTTCRALMRSELTAALSNAGFTGVSWRMSEETGFYQPIVTACAKG